MLVPAAKVVVAAKDPGAVTIAGNENVTVCPALDAVI
jgi:hypothetical protein